MFHIELGQPSSSHERTKVLSTCVTNGGIMLCRTLYFGVASPPLPESGRGCEIVVPICTDLPLLYDW